MTIIFHRPSHRYTMNAFNAIFISLLTACAARTSGAARALTAQEEANKAAVKRVIVEGDLGVLRVKSEPTPGALGTAIVDIFRLENGKIVEHWDVMQPVPEKMAHGNGMF